MSCLPAAIEHRTYYDPRDSGFEQELRRRLARWVDIRRKRAARAADRPGES
jgi:replication-associated recombination protein RarA